MKHRCCPSEPRRTAKRASSFDCPHSVKQKYNVAMYEQEALRHEDIFRSKTMWYLRRSGLYIKAVAKALTTSGATRYKSRANELFATRGIEHATELKAKDPDTILLR